MYELDRLAWEAVERCQYIKARDLANERDDVQLKLEKQEREGNVLPNRHRRT